MPDTPLIFALVTDPGRVRGHNEDAAAAAPGLGAYVVCDGMGGAAGGEIASRLAVDTFLAHISASAPEGGRANGDGSGGGVSRVMDRPRPGSAQAKPQTRLHAAVYAANQAVFAQATDQPELAGMGTTMVALLHVPGPERERRMSARDAKPTFVAPPTLFLANVGDSRCYRWRGGELIQMSTDHSFVEEQVLAGQITADQAAVSPMRNYITRAIGSQAHVEPDLQSYRPNRGDVYLLVSDGLTRELTNAQIVEVLRGTMSSNGPDQAMIEKAGRRLIEAANDSGGNDNITVLLVAIP